MVPYLRQREYGKAAEVGAWQLAWPNTLQMMPALR